MPTARQIHQSETGVKFNTLFVAADGLEERIATGACQLSPARSAHHSSTSPA